MRNFLGLGLVLAVPFLVRGDNALDRAATVKFLQFSLIPDDAADPQPNCGLRATSAAIRAIKYFGGDLLDREAVAKYVKRCYDEQTGGFSDRPGGKPDVALTAI